MNVYKELADIVERLNEIRRVQCYKDATCRDCVLHKSSIQDGNVCLYTLTDELQAITKLFDNREYIPPIDLSWENVKRNILKMNYREFIETFGEKEGCCHCAYYDDSLETCSQHSCIEGIVTQLGKESVNEI